MKFKVTALCKSSNNFYGHYVIKNRAQGEIEISSKINEDTDKK